MAISADQLVTGSFPVHPDLLEILRCPLHPEAGRLLPSVPDPDAAEAGVSPEVPDGAAAAIELHLRCPACGRRFPVRDGIPDLSVRTRDNAAFIGEEARQWDSQSRLYDHCRRHSEEHAASLAAEVEALEPQAGELVLEAACGTGLTIRRYRDVGCRVVALDISLESLRLLRQACGGRVHCVRGDIAYLPFASGVFDRALCANALQHVPTPALRERCLAELGRTVRPGGRAVLSAHQYSRLRRWRGWRREGSALSGSIRYIHRFEKREFEQLLARRLRLERVLGAGYPLPYRLLLTPLSSLIERKLRRGGVAVEWASMLVGVCSVPAPEPGPARPGA